jgi:sulfonate transport system substrate-binding protein
MGRGAPRRGREILDCRYRHSSDIQTIAANRSVFRVGPITDDIVATQQGVADRFFKLGLIPKQIAIPDIVWRNTQT